MDCSTCLRVQMKVIYYLDSKLCSRFRFSSLVKILSFFCTYVANITHILVLRLSFLKLQPQDQEQFEKKHSSKIRGLCLN